jgi:hypothetical protein
MDNGAHSVQLKGVDHPVTLPGFSEREDIATVYTTEEGHPRRQSRILYAALGLCVSKLGGGLDAYEAADLDPVKYGGRFYSSCMADGHKREELLAAAVECFQLVCESLFPREAEVSEVATFTEAQEVAPT